MAATVARATAADAAAIRAIAIADTAGVKSTESLSERDSELCLVTLVAKDTSGTILGYVAVTDRIYGHQIDSVVESIQAVADGLISVGNVGVIQAIGVHPNVATRREPVLRALLRAAFSSLPELDHFIACSDEGSRAMRGELSSLFLHVPLNQYENVFVCPRQRVLPTMYVRSARVEDFDDLVPVFSSQSEVVKERFGEYFLAEVIEARSATEKVLVGEGPDGRAVGLMAVSTSSEQSLPVLRASFELAPHGHLLRASTQVEELGARATQLEARHACDWYSILSSHAEELETLFDSLPALSDALDVGAPSHLVVPLGRPAEDALEGEAKAAADAEAVLVADIVSLFDAKGDAWGYTGVGGVRLGTCMMGDLGISTGTHKEGVPAISRTGLNLAVADFAGRRELVHRRMRVARWYTYSPDSDRPMEEPASEGKRPGSAPPVPAPVQVPHVPAGPPSGRKLMTEEFEKLEATETQRRKEGIRVAQQAQIAAQKEVDASSQADRVAHEAELKEKFDKEVADRKAAGQKAAKKTDAAAASGFKPVAVPKSSSTLLAEEKLATAARGILAAQAAMTQPVRVNMQMLSAAINIRLAADGVPSESSSGSGLEADGSPSSAPSGPAMEMLLDCETLLAEAKAQVIVELTPAGAKSPYADPSDETAATKPVFAAVLGLWEARCLPEVNRPVFTVTSRVSPHYALTPTAVESIPAPTPGEESVASTASLLLGLPRLHVPDFLAHAALAFAEQERVRAEEEAKRKADDEKRRKKEEDEAKKALVSGAAKLPSKDAKDKAKGLPEAAGGKDSKKGSLLIDPSADPCGALVQRLKTDGLFARGVILTGMPAFNISDSAKLQAALMGAGMPMALNLHANESGSAASPHSATLSTAHPDSAHSVHLPSGRTTGHASIYASERVMVGALQRRNSFADAASKGLEEDASLSTSIPLLPVHSPSSPWLGCLGCLVHVDADVAHLTEMQARRDGRAHHMKLGGKQSLDTDGGADTAALLQEVLLGIFLRGGYVTRDPTSPPREARGTSASEARQTYMEAEGRDAENLDRPANAFAVTLFCLTQDLESRSVDLLAAAFEAYPDREYCLLTQPHSAPDLPLLRRFVRVPAKSNSTLNAALYVCHRDSLLTPALVTVRRAGAADRPTIASLARSTPDSDAFLDAVVAAEYRKHQPLLHGPNGAAARIAAFVAEVDGSILGCVVLCNTGSEAEAVRAAARSFDLERHMGCEHYIGERNPADAATIAADDSADSPSTHVASLLHVVLSPTLMSAAPFVLRQALRLYGDKHAALYRQAASALGSHIDSPLPLVVRECMVPVRPRRLPELAPTQAAAREAARAKGVSSRRVHTGVMDSITRAAFTVAALSRPELADPRSLDHCLYVFTGRGSTVRRPHVNSRVVVIGASDTAIAAVTALILEPTVALTNVTVVCPGGLPQSADAFLSPAPFTPGREFTSFELSRLPLSSHVTVVDDALHAISRKDKTVSLIGPSDMGGQHARLKYDALLLFPGLTESTWGSLGYPSQADMPRGMHCLTHAEALSSLAADVEALAAQFASMDEEEEEEGEGPPPNVDPQGSQSSMSTAIMLGSSDMDVVVYGDSLEALTAINALLDRGVPGKRIMHIRPCTRAWEAPLPGHPVLPSVAQDVIDDLLPTGTGAPLTGDGMFASKAVASVLSQAGVRTVLGAEVVGVTSSEAGAEGEEGATGLDEDGLPLISIPGLTIELKIRRLPSTESDLAEAAALSSQSMESDVTRDSKTLDEEGTESLIAEPPPPEYEQISIPAALLLCAAARDVDPRFFKAVDDSGIVYDGRLVVDHNFVATDPAIFGGGSVAKFSRRYRAPMPLAAQDSQEVGNAVCASVLRFIKSGAVADPAAAHAAAQAALGPASTLPSLLPVFVNPKVTRALLPGNLHYLRTRLPTLDMGTTGREILTFVPPNRQAGTGLRFSRLVIGRYGTLGEVEYVGNDAVEVGNLATLPGVHAAFLNGLERRADAKVLPDAISFLRQDWATALYHDRCRTLLDSLRTALAGKELAAVGWTAGNSKEDTSGLPSAHPVLAGLMEQVRKLIDGEVPGASDAALKAINLDGVGITGVALPPEVRHKVETELMAFLKMHSGTLPMYLNPQHA